jgi:hypothetical protein
MRTLTSPGAAGALLRAAASALLLVLTTACTAPAPRGSDPPTSVAPAPEPSGEERTTTPTSGERTRRALRLLAAWDARRSEALGGRDRAALAALYPPGSSLLRQDEALLRAYDRRGLRVVDVVTQVRQAHVLAAGRDRVRLRVRERLAGAGFRAAGEHYRVSGSRYVTRVLTLQRSGGAWRLSASTRG